MTEIALNLFKRMLTYKNFIVGNSTFTLWAALLSDKNSKVIIDEKFSYQLNMNDNYFQTGHIRVLDYIFKNII